MLGLRIVTAIVLLVLLVPALLADNPIPFAAFTLLMIAAAGWEWARLNQHPGPMAWIVGGLVGVLSAAGWLLPSSDSWMAHLAPADFTRPVIAAVALAWLVLSPWGLSRGVSAWNRLAPSFRLALGVVILVVAWWSLTWAKLQGVAFILSTFCIVWVADVAAYAGGRTWGRRKLAVTISPGKTWEGAATAACAVLLMAVVWVLTDQQMGLEPGHLSVFSVLQRRWGWVGMLALLAILVAMSIVGDLVESLVKRAAGAKDSSQLLPGHGGVLDRIDALLPVFPLAVSLAV
jgi:phosphatidate cytidylyltransferase